MKVTKAQLKNIIKEELQSVLDEGIMGDIGSKLGINTSTDREALNVLYQSALRAQQVIPQIKDALSGGQWGQARAELLQQPDIKALVSDAKDALHPGLKSINMAYSDSTLKDLQQWKIDSEQQFNIKNPKQAKLLDTFTQVATAVLDLDNALSRGITPGHSGQPRR